jgi:outer membrane protein W
MLRSTRERAVLAIVAVAVLLAPAAAMAQSQSITFTAGFFAPKGEDGRVDDDVLIAELSSSDPLLFEIGDFVGGNIGAEYLIGLGDYLEAGVGVSYYRRTVPSVYELSVRPSGEEIEQDLRLRIAPVTATLRFYPMGKFHGFQPYVGAGISRLNFRFSEVGDFIDPADGTIFSNRYAESGSTVAPLFLGGLRYPIAGRFLVGGEARYQSGEGDLPTGGTDGFIASKIDLGGWTGNFTFGVTF